MKCGFWLVSATKLNPLKFRFSVSIISFHRVSNLSLVPGEASLIIWHLEGGVPDKQLLQVVGFSFEVFVSLIEVRHGYFSMTLSCMFPLGSTVLHLAGPMISRLISWMPALAYSSAIRIIWSSRSRTSTSPVSGQRDSFQRGNVHILRELVPPKNLFSRAGKGSALTFLNTESNRPHENVFHVQKW